MIVVVGLPAYADSPDGERCAGGLVVEVAAAARRRGGRRSISGRLPRETERGDLRCYGDTSR